MQLHSYQEEVVDNIIEEFKTYTSLMLQMPTGTGKTLIFCEVLQRFRNNFFDNSNRKDSNRRILILVHKEHLIDQVKNELTKVIFKDADIGIIRSGKKRNVLPMTVIAMVQTLANDIKNKNNKKKSRDIPEHVLLVIIDEAHHSGAESWKTIIEYYKKQGAKLLGVTATPKRSDGNGFENEYEKLISSYSLRWFIESGFLAKYKHYATAEPDLKNIREIANDYDTNILSHRMSDKKIMAEVIKSYDDYAKNGKAIVFAVNKLHAKQIKERFEEKGIQCGYIHSHSKKSERAEIRKKFENGDIKVLCNVNIFTEGFDCPDAEVAILARPTKSLVLYLQMIGRILRRDKNIPNKTALILDNAMLWKEHGLVSTDREWSLRGGRSLEDEFESYIDDDKEVKIRRRKKVIVKEDKRLELQEIDSVNNKVAVINNHPTKKDKPLTLQSSTKNNKVKLKPISFALQSIKKNQIIYTSNILSPQFPNTSIKIENKLQQLAAEKNYDEIRIEADTKFFIHWKKNKIWKDWKEDKFEYIFIQDYQHKFSFKSNKQILSSLNEKELPMSKVLDIIMEDFRSKFAQKIQNSETHFFQVSLNRPFFICFSSPYFYIDFSTFNIPFPYEYYKNSILQKATNVSMKSDFEKMYKQINLWLKIIENN